MHDKLVKLVAIDKARIEAHFAASVVYWENGDMRVYRDAIDDAQSAHTIATTQVLKS